MSFNWRTYFYLAEKLVENENAASFRSAISRSYYAIFNVLRIRAGHHSSTPSHQEFIRRLKNPSEDLFYSMPFDDKSDLIYIGNELDHLRATRNKSDYDGTYTVTKSLASNILSKVEYIFEMLDEADED